ncbi:MAG: endonuclease domain-containing protein [Candidatus Competibacterales bacterium]
MRPQSDTVKLKVRRLRREATPAEAVLWDCLRDRRCRGFKFRRQVPVGPYIVDFLCPAAKLAVELDGNHHREPEQRVYDQLRDQYLNQRGLDVVRIANDEVIHHPHRALARITAHLEANHAKKRD